MVVVSLQERQDQKCFLIELEEYKPNHKRHGKYILGTQGQTSDQIKDDPEFVWHVGYYIFLGLIVGHTRNSKWGPKCLKIYPEIRGKRDILLFGYEKFVSDENREFCTRLEIPHTNTDKISEDTEFLIRVGLTVLNYLPMPENNQSR